MKIGNPAEKPLAVTPATSQGAGVDSAKAGSSTATLAAPTAGAPDPSAKVELSSTAAALLSGATPFDAEKVARISQAIAEGSFKINPEVIADKLIGNARELLSKVDH
ncbi:MAG: flagellar biosynthesis anti-sigma factor FlgM [Caldimonas sp.]